MTFIKGTHCVSGYSICLNNSKYKAVNGKIGICMIRWVSAGFAMTRNRVQSVSVQGWKGRGKGLYGI